MEAMCEAADNRRRALCTHPVALYLGGSLSGSGRRGGVTSGGGSSSGSAGSVLAVLVLGLRRGRHVG